MKKDQRERERESRARGLGKLNRLLPENPRIVFCLIRASLGQVHQSFFGLGENGSNMIYMNTLNYTIAQWHPRKKIAE